MTVNPADKRKPAAGSRSDAALILLGCGAAALSAAFAAYSVSVSGGAPDIPGSEHLLIFARPSQPRQTSPIAVATREPQASPIETDPITTGSIRPRPRREHGNGTPSPQALIESFTLRGIFNGKALLQGPDGFIMAGPGANIRGAGTIRTIEATPKGWAVTTSEGRIE
ncbi:MAG: hypothetical protein K2P80_04950 [Beijerinckiaceae bacterium]|nr:hypothetical protein [Beijerinckiaceae bacterium]